MRQKQKRIRVLVTAVGAEPGRNVVRALDGKKDIEVVVTDSDPLAPALYDTGEISGSYLLPRTNDEGAYISRITDIVKKEGINVIMPCIEDEVFALSKNKNHFSGMGAAVVCPEYKKVLMATDKKTISEIAHQAGIPTPRTCLLRSYVEKRPVNIEYPIIIKPRIGRGAKNVFVAKEKDDWNRALYCLREKLDDYIVQAYIPGKTGSIFLCGLLYSKRGEVIAEFLSRSLKTLFDFGGSAMCGEPVKGFERLKRYSKELIESIGGWYGPVNIEYKISSRDGIPYILEVNPRFWGYGLLAVRSGINFPYIAVMDAVERKYEPQTSYRDDFILLREFKDSVITQDALKKSHFDKTVCVFGTDSLGPAAVQNITRLSKPDMIDKIVITGKNDIGQELTRKFGNNAKVSFYRYQAPCMDDNLYEIALYNYANALIYIKDVQQPLKIREMSKDISSFLDKEKLQNLNADAYLMMKFSFLRQCINAKSR